MGFLDDVKRVMEQHRAKGQNYVMMDTLAFELGIKGEAAKRGEGPGLMPNEVLTKKLDLYYQLSQEGEVSFPFEIVTYRGRAEGGIPDMEKREYRSLPIKDDDGNVKLTKGGEEQIQRYYIPALMWVNPEKAKGKQAILELAQVLNPYISENQFAVSADGLTLTITYLLPNTTRPAVQVA
jgi:hypothetical protein